MVLTSNFKAKLRRWAEKKGVDPKRYSDYRISERYREAMLEGIPEVEFVKVLLNEIDFLSTQQKKEQGTFGKSICPGCGKMTLVHEGGCESCKECGYSRCG